MKHLVYILIIFTIIAASCKPLSKIGNKSFEIENITKNNFQKLNGTYANNFDTIVGQINRLSNDSEVNDYQHLTILDQLFNNYPNKMWGYDSDQIVNPKEKWIKIEFQSKKLATIGFYRNDNFIFSTNIHGKLKKGYFYLRPKVLVLPLVPLVIAYNFDRMRIGKTKDNKLLIDYHANHITTLFLLITGGKIGVATTIFKKKNNILEHD